VFPGSEWVIPMTFDEPGTYHVVCNEFCGQGHRTMHGRFTVVVEGYVMSAVAPVPERLRRGGLPDVFCNGARHPSVRGELREAVRADRGDRARRGRKLRLLGRDDPMGVHRPARPEQLLHAPEYPRVEPAHLLDGVHGDRRPLRRRSDGARSSAPASSARDRWVGAPWSPARSA